MYVFNFKIHLALTIFIHSIIFDRTRITAIILQDYIIFYLNKRQLKKLYLMRNLSHQYVI